MHYFARQQRVRLIGEHLVREVSATTSKLPSPVAVFREFDDGRRQSRNVYYLGAAGWLFQHPSDVVEGKRYGVERWAAGFAPKNEFCWDRPSASDVELIAQSRPAFRWCLEKAVAAQYSTAELFALMRNFARDPRVEHVVQYKELAVSPMLLKWPLAHVRALYAFRAGVPADHLPVGAADACVRLGIDLEEYRRWKLAAPKMAWRDWRFLVDRGIPIAEYEEYLETVRAAGKDQKDDYWRKPADFAARRRQVERIIRNQRRALSRERAAERRKREQALGAVADRFRRGTFRGLRVWVPSTLKEIVAQAKALSQCLVDCDYAQRVIDWRCVLVFLAGSAGPVATCELLPRKRRGGEFYKIGQFYGDESRSDYLATDAQRRALLAWTQKNELKIA
jgi:hypothetical protein